MVKEQMMVREFHQAFNIEAYNTPIMPDRGTRDLRVKLIEEELTELKDAFDLLDPVAIADALGDLLYVVYGAANACGIDMEPVFNEVHRSNMTKVGGVKREDGKLLKPASYSPPELEPILRAQGGNGFGSTGIGSEREPHGN